MRYTTYVIIMQPRPKQQYQAQTQNYYNKLNYHLKKTQPFKNKVKRTVTEQMRAYAKNDKVSTIPNHKKTLPVCTSHPKVEESPQPINQQHLNQNIANVSSQVKIYQTPGSIRKNIFDRGNSDSRLKKLDVAERGKSLKYWRVEKTQPKFVTHIKGFFNTFLSDDDGCKCGPNCECRQTLIKWIGVPDELIQKNYSRLLRLAYGGEEEKYSRNGDTQNSSYGQNYQYESQSQKLLRSKHQVQIQKDVIRTQTQCELFHRKPIQEKMERILMCYSVEDPEVGYVQSMNIVMSGVLYHVRDEAKTYAICRKLFHEIRRIYLKDFKQCYHHVDFVIRLLQKYALDLYKHLQQVGVQMRVVLFPWVLSLLCVVVPLDYLRLIYVGFVRHGWKFIYKVILSVFIYHKDKLRDMDESGDILVFLSVSNDEKQSIDWEDIANFADHLKIHIQND